MIAHAPPGLALTVLPEETCSPDCQSSSVRSSGGRPYRRLSLPFMPSSPCSCEVVRVRASHRSPLPTGEGAVMEPLRLYRLESGVVFIVCPARWADIVRVGLHPGRPPGVPGLANWPTAPRYRHAAVAAKRRHSGLSTPMRRSPHSTLHRSTQPTSLSSMTSSPSGGVSALPGQPAERSLTGRVTVLPLRQDDRRCLRVKSIGEISEEWEQAGDTG